MKGQDIINMLSQGIDMISQKLGVAADKIYPVLLKQAQYDMVMDIIWSVIGSILLIIAITLTIKIRKIIKTDDEVLILISIIGIVVGYFVGILITIICIPNIIQIIINPQYYIFTHYIRPLINN
jgi:hypothetical protein